MKPNECPKWRSNIMTEVLTLLLLLGNMENSGNLKKLSKSQGNLNFNLQEKTWKTQGKSRICGRIGDENVFQ